MNTMQWTRKLVGSVLLAVAAGIATPLFALAEESAPAEVQLAPVNVNTADAATIAATMRGIGLSRAQAIVDYREQHGPFKSVDELVNVKGVGNKTLENNRARISI